MVRREWSRFVVDVKAFRPLITVVLVVLVMLPDLKSMLTAEMLPLTVLVRLAETMLVMNLVTWCGAKIVTRYATIQAKEEFAANEAKMASDGTLNSVTESR